MKPSDKLKLAYNVVKGTYDLGRRVARSGSGTRSYKPGMSVSYANVPKKQVTGSASYNKLQIIKPTTVGMSKSSDVTVYKHKKKQNIPAVTKLLFSPFTVESLTTTGSICGISTQNAFIATPYNFSSNSGIGSPKSITYAMDKSLSYINAAGNTTSSAKITPGQQSFKFEVSSLNTTLLLQNQAQYQCDLDIYDLVSKVTDELLYDPTLAWTQGLTNIGKGSSPNAGFLYSVPTTSKVFNTQWRVNKKTSVSLGAGTSHQHTWDFKPNVIIDSEYFNTNTVVKGLSHCVMVVLRSQLADDANSQSIGKIGTSRGKIIGICRVKTILRPINSIPRGYLAVDAIDHSATTQYIATITNGAATDTNVQNTGGSTFA